MSITTSSSISPLQSFAAFQANLPMNVPSGFWEGAAPTPAIQATADTRPIGGHFSGERATDPSKNEHLTIPVMKHALTRRREISGIAWDSHLKDLPPDFFEQEAALTTSLDHDRAVNVVQQVKRQNEGCDGALWKLGDPFPCEDFVPPGSKPDRNGLWNTGRNRGGRNEVKMGLVIVIIAAAAVVAWLL